MTELDDARLSALYRRAPQPEPGAGSDDLIRAEARRAAKAQRARRTLSGWAPAATLVLGAGIGWQLLLVRPSLQVPATPRAAGRSLAPAAPAGVAGETRAHKAHPSRVETMQSDAATSLACDRQWLADDAAPSDWHAQIAQLRRSVQVELADCLQRRYRQLFGADKP